MRDVNSSPTVKRRPGGRWPIPTDGVYIGRPSKWGNPFFIGRDGTREEVVAKYREWIATQPELLLDLHELIGKDLYCWCAPRACHGDILLELSNRLQGTLIGDRDNATIRPPSAGGSRRIPGATVPTSAPQSKSRHF